MEITSIQFFIFVACSLLIYWKLPFKYQWVLLLIDSLIFYAANSTIYTFVYILITVVSIFISSKLFVNSLDEKTKKRTLIITIALNVLILGLLKYVNLFIDTFNYLNIRLIDVNPISNIKWIAPLAISYYTLQMISYLLDCYWGITEPFSNPFKLLLYCIYFPLMISGPICRKEEVGNELFNYHIFDYDKTKLGLYRISWGLLKKLTISNRLAIIVNQMWDNPYTSTGVCVWISMVLFVFQLYTDFSGCMDIVIGVSNCFGIQLPENFNAPFFSKTTQEYWQRWHITLGSWFKDYIMSPVLRSKKMILFSKWCKRSIGKGGRKIPAYIATLIVWLVMGLWHGNSWKYVLMGFWFWFIITLSQILEPAFKTIKNKLKINDTAIIWRIFQIVRTFFIYLFGTVLFRADSISDAFARIKAGFRVDMSLQFLSDIRKAVRFDDVSGVYGLVAIAIGIIFVLVVDYMKYKEIDYIKKLTTSKWYVRWIIYYAIAILLVTSLDITNQEILYAQF